MPAFLVVAHVERAYPNLYFNPSRWDTADGYIPWRLFLLYAAALYPVWAMDRLTMSSAIALALADDKSADGKAFRSEAVAEAYPEAPRG